MNTQLETQHAPNFSVTHAGDWKDLAQHVFEHPVLGKVPGKLFLKDTLQMTALEISLGSIPPGRGTPFSHRHRENEEVYIFVGGRGQFQVDGQVVEVREGTVIRVGCAGARAWRNTSTEPLRYIVIQARAGTLANGTTTDGLPVADTVTWPPNAA
jgi:mannose-6-phosphate isomerase-like protein (cupin superfamily)